MNKKNEIAIKIAGEAGFGIKVSGLILGKTLFKQGFSVFGYTEYPSLIRGGHNVYQLNISEKAVVSATSKIDILIALNQETIDKHEKELNKDGVIIHDGLRTSYKNIVDIPLMELSKKAGSPLTRNMIALGVVMKLIGMDLKYLEEQIKQEFDKKGKEAVEMNKKAIKFGYNFIDENKLKINNYELKAENKTDNKNDFIITGNEAAAKGIIQSGCKLYSAYPMTPATSIMHILVAEQRENEMVVHQTEDEISAIGAAIGAAVTGVRSATGTSGGGFALMTENLGLAAITETPLVIIESQRTAPATGLPTWTEQGDLQFVINASHGEFPRVVIAPGDAEESYYMIQNGFNLAEKFQIPVIFLLDKYISESDFVLKNMDKEAVPIKREGFMSDDELERIRDYKRYEFTKTGISRRALPGQAGGVHVINSDDHDEYGFSTEEAEVRKQMMDKRFRKLPLIEAELPEPVLYGPKEADLTVVSWGSMKGVVLDAIEASGKKVNFLHLAYIWPFPKRKVKSVLENAKNILLVENNKTGQLGHLIRQETGIEIKNRFLKYDGRPPFREEIVEIISKIQGTRNK